MHHIYQDQFVGIVLANILKLWYYVIDFIWYIYIYSISKYFKIMVLCYRFHMIWYIYIYIYTLKYSQASGGISLNRCIILFLLILSPEHLIVYIYIYIYIYSLIRVLLIILVLQFVWVITLYSTFFNTIMIS